MQIKDRPEYARKGAVLTMAGDASVASAISVMSEINYGAMVIVSANQKRIGIVTERDFMRRLLVKALASRQSPVATRYGFCPVARRRLKAGLERDSDEVGGSVKPKLNYQN